MSSGSFEPFQPRPHFFCAIQRALLGSVEFFVHLTSPQDPFLTSVEVLRELEATLSSFGAIFPLSSLEGCSWFIRRFIDSVNQTSTLGCHPIHVSNAFLGPDCWKGVTRSKVMNEPW